MTAVYTAIAAVTVSAYSTYQGIKAQKASAAAKNARSCLYTCTSSAHFPG